MTAPTLNLINSISIVNYIADIKWASGIMGHDVFISYSSINKNIADIICHILEQNNIQCWIMPRNTIYGEDKFQQIFKAIKSAKIVVAVLTEDYTEDDYAKYELQTAFSNNKPIK